MALAQQGAHVDDSILQIGPDFPIQYLLETVEALRAQEQQPQQSLEDVTSFEAAKEYAGSRPNGVFTKGPGGLGYFADGWASMVKRRRNGKPPQPRH